MVEERKKNRRKYRDFGALLKQYRIQGRKEKLLSSSGFFREGIKGCEFSL